MDKAVTQNSTDLSQFLNDVFMAKRKKNPKYSMRAFARDLSLTQGRLWELIHGRYIPGPKVAARIAEVLSLDPADKLKLMEMIQAAKASPARTLKALSESEFAMISDWEHFALINLIGTKECKSSVSWIAKRLRISELQAEGALNRLLEAGLVVEDGGALRASHTNFHFGQEVPSKVLRESQRQILQQSLHSLEVDPIDVRSVTSITFPSNVKNLSKAKKLIAEFSERMAELMEKGERTEVYNLAVQLVPVTAALN